ncbi:MAG: hypothetical protein H6840_12290 [Planctomycetes bacterium]|nr:hypothetical protein [Planctomycetota bacterium]
MTAQLAEFLPWIGVWTGVGESQAGQPCFVRNRFFPGLEGDGLGMQFEAWDPGMTTLFHGVRAVLATAPSGVMRALAYSTIHGALILELTPDDPGVMALAGESVAGNRISVTFLQEEPGRLLFTAFWRPAMHERQPNDGPRMTCGLTRAVPKRPPGV